VSIPELVFWATCMCLTLQGVLTSILKRRNLS